MAMTSTYVSRLTANITRASDLQRPLTIKVIDSEEINASIGAGYRLYLNTGPILASDNEAELAGVLAHEIAHLTTLHAARIRRRRRFGDSRLFVAGQPDFLLKCSASCSR